MRMEEALKIVLDLAVQNTIDENDDFSEWERQDKATTMVSGLVDAMGDQ